MNRIQELEIERKELRNETRGVLISSWKFWQYNKDKILLKKCRRVLEINNILDGVELQKELTSQTVDSGKLGGNHENN